jgi:hypothetical protein
LTKTDIAGTGTGSAGLLSLRKDVNKRLRSLTGPPGEVHSVATSTALGAVKGDFAQDADGVFSGVPTTATNHAGVTSLGKGLTLQVTNDSTAVGIEVQSLVVLDRGTGYEVGDIIKFDETDAAFPAALRSSTKVQYYQHQCCWKYIQHWNVYRCGYLRRDRNWLNC